ncbi:hypothetical protein TrVE_jg7044 [Triparma verrucosa]|uniref:Uncharacterized protein n=1 Tax=Triparma verrucosa TaxID=1606542 RepID=A0A9W7BK36_9STRA|nr:hypothetical protein TrVE_jg7044 [Triparma verrucosa]
MFGDLSEAFENLDTRDVNSPSRPRAIRSPKKSTGAFNFAPTPTATTTAAATTTTTKKTTDEAHETFSTPNLLSPSPTTAPPSTHSITSLALSNSLAYKKLSSKSESYKKKISNLQANVEQREADVENLNSRYRTEKASKETLANQVKRLDSQIDSLTSQISSQKLNHQKLLSADLSKDETIKNLQSRINDLKSHIQEQSYVQEGEGRRVKAAMDGMNVIVNNLRSKVQSQESLLASYESLKSSTSELEGRLSNLTEENSKLKEDNAYLQSQRSEWTTTLEANKNLKESVRRLKSQNDTLKSSQNLVTTLTEKNEGLESSLKKVTVELSSANESLKTLKAKYSKHVPPQKYKTLESTLLSTSQTLEETSSKTASLTLEYSTLKSRHSSHLKCLENFSSYIKHKCTQNGISKSLIKRNSTEYNYEDFELYGTEVNKIFKDCYETYLKVLFKHYEEDLQGVTKLRDTLEEMERNSTRKDVRITKLLEDNKGFKVAVEGGRREREEKDEQMRKREEKEEKERKFRQRVKREVGRVGRGVGGMGKGGGEGREIYDLEERLKGLREFAGREEGGEDFRDLLEAFVGVGEEFRGTWEEGRRSKDEIKRLQKEMEGLQERVKETEGEASTRHKLLEERERETEEKDRKVREAVTTFHDFMSSVESHALSLSGSLTTVGSLLGLPPPTQPLLLHSRSRSSSGFTPFPRPSDSTGVSNLTASCVETSRTIDETFRSAADTIEGIKRNHEAQDLEKKALSESLEKTDKEALELRRTLEGERLDFTTAREGLKSEVERLKAECILKVTEAEGRCNREGTGRVQALSREVDGGKQVIRGLRDEVSGLRRSLKEYRERLSGVEERGREGREGVGKVGRALRLVVRGVVPMSRRLAELRSEKSILWNLVKESWVWENELLQLAGAIEGGGRRRIRMRSVVVMVLASNRLRKLGAMARRKFGGEEEFYTPGKAVVSHVGKRRRVNSQFAGMLGEEEVEEDVEVLGRRLPDCTEGGEVELERVVGAVVRGEGEWFGRGGWEGGDLIHDLARGLFESLRRGYKVGSDRAPDSVRNVRAGMGKMARRINEMEEERTNSSKVRINQERELKRYKDYTSKLVSALNDTRSQNKSLDARSQALAFECLSSVPESKMTALNEELLQQKKIHTDMTQRYADLQKMYAEKEVWSKTNEELVKTVKEELERTNMQLEGEREEVVRLRTLSEGGGEGGGKKKGKKK